MCQLMAYIINHNKKIVYVINIFFLVPNNIFHSDDRKYLLNIIVKCIKNINAN